MNAFKKTYFIALIAVLCSIVSDYSFAEEIVDEDCFDIDYMCDFLEDDEGEGGNEVSIPDPFEKVNRAVFEFNDRFYIYVVDPVATGYASMLPEDIRGCVASFLNNLDEPIRLVNALLQGRIRDSGVITGRFLINSTLGVYGLADVADKEFNIKPVEATMGETLGAWGLEDGYYLVLPFLGPSTVRDFTGTMIDFIGPSPYGYVTNYEYVGQPPSMIMVYAGGTLNTVSLHLGEYEDLKDYTLDPYIAFKNAYFQHSKQ
ncbi:MAG: VacJ family lipoprotein [Desulfobulbaceae bacterium]|nr:VacJ family lipoprotein [Desulfobulbaceae bacterium]